MNENNPQKNNALAGLKIQTDIALWQLLLQGIKKSHKMSRVEAFYDLIDRHCIAMLKGENNHISGTIHSIAKAWGWDRETVAKFLEHLQKLGMVTINNDGNRKAIMLNCITLPKMDSGASEKPSDAKTPSFATKGK